MSTNLKRSESTDDSSSNSINLNGSSYKCWPIIRNEYRKRAVDAIGSGDSDRAILYDSKALSCGFISTQLINDHTNAGIDDNVIGRTIHVQQTPVNSLIDYLSECLNELDFNESNRDAIDADDQMQIDDLYGKCAKLPTQWNVIQISQMYDEYNGYSTTKDLYTADGPMVLTMFRYNLAEKRENRPFRLTLELSEFNPKSMFSAAYEINQVLYKSYVKSMNTPGYNDFIKSLSMAQSKLVSEMSMWLGPWTVLLSGKIKGKSGEQFESKLFDEVAKLCDEFDDFPVDQLVLLCLVARRLDLLNSTKIKQAARDIGRNQQEFTRIAEWLAQLKRKTPFTDFQYYPSILVLDELVDPMPWELIQPQQEFSRVHSIYLLFDLYEKFKDQIKDGYFRVCIKNGFALINPDADEKLGDMSKRMCKYYNEYLNQWPRMERQMPTGAEITDALQNNNVFVYSGHGSALQCFTEAELNVIHHKCPMFLFGCESIAMKPRGTICEARCSSYTYFKCGCPGILGALTIVTDIWVDLISILILTQWVLPKNITHPIIDICRDDNSKERVNKILFKYKGKRNPNLLALLCDIRNEKDISERMRSAMIYRGLPIHNTAIDKECS